MSFLAELNKLEYLEAKTLKKVYIIAGPKFGEKQGNTLIINKALYSLRSSGQQ